MKKAEIQKFIESFDGVSSLVLDKLIESDAKFRKFKNLRTDYYISFISPLPKSNTDFEVNFEALDKINESYFFIELRNGILKNNSL